MFWNFIVPAIPHMSVYICYFWKKNLGIIIFARASSKRLQKSVFKINKTPLIKIIIKRVKSSKFKFPIVIATSKNKSDDAMKNFASK